MTTETVAYVVARNHAWLITITGARTDDATPTELFDAASTLKAAKAIAVCDAARFGYRGPFTWRQESADDHPNRWWALDGVDPEEDT